MMRLNTLIQLCFISISIAAQVEAADEFKDIQLDKKGQAVQVAEDALDDRREYEQQSYNNPFAITPHLVNYMMPVTYVDSINAAPHQFDKEGLSNIEMKFQISVKVPVWRNMFDDNGHLFFAYTQQAFWQAYNSEISSPFRETNHEPEVFFSYDLAKRWKEHKAKNIRFGISHQSNGRSGLSSRSWNRLYVEFMWQSHGYTYRIKPWWRLPEKEKESVFDAKGDDNPDIHKFMGYAEANVIKKFDDSTLFLKARHNLSGSHQRGAIELGWSYPVSDRLRGYVQLFNGYGESLIDYNDSNTRIGIGIMLTDWL
jgi:phospholipase A1/A2